MLYIVYPTLFTAYLIFRYIQKKPLVKKEFMIYTILAGIPLISLMFQMQFISPNAEWTDILIDPFFWID
jgi:hypothetical protein